MSGRAHLTCLLCALSLTTCKHDSLPDDIATSQPPDVTTPSAASTPPVMNSPPDTPPSLLTHEGVLEMARIPGGKAFQPTTLLLDDGHQLLLSYRPIPAHFHLVGKRVIVSGQPQKLSRNIQQVGGDHFTATSITAHDKELSLTPRDTLPDTPLIATYDEARALHSRWVHVHGTFKKGVPAEDPQVTVTLSMKADGPLTISIHQNDYDELWRPLIGQPVTLMGKLHFPPEQDVPELITPVQLCKGQGSRCTPP